MEKEISGNGMHSLYTEKGYTAHGNKEEVPIWEKVCLTIEEAAAYSNIGISKLYEITSSPTCRFVLHVGTRKRLVKRKEFEKYLLQSIEI